MHSTLGTLSPYGIPTSPGASSSSLPKKQSTALTTSPQQYKQPARSFTSPGQRSTTSHDTGFGSRGKSRLNTSDNRASESYSHEYESDSRPTSSVVGPRAVTGSPHPLQAEIDRLTAACEEHERKIRVAKATIEHRLFSEWPQMFSRLSAIDEEADRLTTQIHAALQSTIPAHQSRLDKLIQARRNDVEQVKERTTPWTTFFALQEEEERLKARLIDSDNGVNGVKMRLSRIDGVQTEQDSLSKLEGWAEEVVSAALVGAGLGCFFGFGLYWKPGEIYLSAEIIRLRTQLNSMSWRRRLVVRVVVLGFSFLALLIAIGYGAQFI